MNTKTMTDQELAEILRAKAKAVWSELEPSISELQRRGLEAVVCYGSRFNDVHVRVEYPKKRL